MERKRASILLTLVTVTVFFLTSGSVAATETTIDTGDTAWILISSALVLLMIPGVAFFYGGIRTRGHGNRCRILAPRSCSKPA